MFKIMKYSLIYTICISLTAGHWMPYMNGKSVETYPQSITEELILPEKSNKNIPIIVLLKPKKSRQLSADSRS